MYHSFDLITYLWYIILPDRPECAPQFWGGVRPTKVPSRNLRRNPRSSCRVGRSTHLYISNHMASWASRSRKICHPMNNRSNPFQDRPTLRQFLLLLNSHRSKQHTKLHYYTILSARPFYPCHTSVHWASRRTRSTDILSLSLGSSQGLNHFPLARCSRQPFIWGQSMPSDRHYRRPWWMLWPLEAMRNPWCLVSHFTESPHSIRCGDSQPSRTSYSQCLWPWRSEHTCLYLGPWRVSLISSLPKLPDSLYMHQQLTGSSVLCDISLLSGLISCSVTFMLESWSPLNNWTLYT